MAQHKFHITPSDQIARPCSGNCIYGDQNVIGGDTIEEAYRNQAIANGTYKLPTISKALNIPSQMTWTDVNVDEAFAQGKDFAAQLKANNYIVKDADGNEFPKVNLSTRTKRPAEFTSAMSMQNVNMAQAMKDGQKIAQELRSGKPIIDADGNVFPQVGFKAPQARRKNAPLRQVSQRHFSASAEALQNLTSGKKNLVMAGRDGSRHSIAKTASGYQSTSTLSDGSIQIFPQVQSFSFASN